MSSRRLHHLYCATLALGLAGCGPKIELLRHSESFTYQSLKSGKLAVCGVTSLVGDDEQRADVHQRVSVLLETALMKERGDLGVVPAGMARAELEDVLDLFERTGELHEPAIATLREVLGGQVRYVVLARIKDRTVSRNETAQDPDQDTKTDNTKYKKTTSTTVRVGFEIYDLERAESAWSADLVGTENSSVTYGEESKSETKGFMAVLEAVVTAITPDRTPAYPEPPHMTEVLHEIFDKFAENLPKAKR